MGRAAYTGWQEFEFVAGDNTAPIEGNAYFPLLPASTTYATEGTTIEREVTTTVRDVDGIGCKLVVEQEYDTATLELLEVRERLFAQDLNQTIWACGVLRQQYSAPEAGADPVVTSTRGSWQAGTDGAQAGIAMPAHPAFGESFRRSYAPGVEEELTEVIDPAAVESSFVCASDCVILRVTSPLEESGYRDEYYESSIGLVHSEDANGDNPLDLQP